MVGCSTTEGDDAVRREGIGDVGRTGFGGVVDCSTREGDSGVGRAGSVGVVG